MAAKNSSGPAKTSSGRSLFALQLADTAQVLLRRAAAVVAHPVEEHQRLAGVVQFGRQDFHVVLQVAAPRGVRIGDAESQHAAAVVGLPPENPPGQLFFVRRGAHEHIIRHAALLEDLRQHAVVAETVHAVTHRAGQPKFLFEIALAVQPLAHERLARRDIAVRLDPPAAGQLPAPFGHPPAYLGEHGRVGLLDPLVKGRLAGGEHEIGVLVHAVERRAEGGVRLVVAVLPLPQPDRVDVGVADQVKTRGLFGILFTLCSSSMPASSASTAIFFYVQNNVVDISLNYTFLLLKGNVNQDANAASMD